MMMMEINRDCPIIRKYIIRTKTFEGGGEKKNEVSSRYQEIEELETQKLNVERQRCVDQ
jgi:hypothetical protein